MLLGVILTVKLEFGGTSQYDLIFAINVVILLLDYWNINLDKIKHPRQREKIIESYTANSSNICSHGNSLSWYLEINRHCFIAYVV